MKSLLRQKALELRIKEGFGYGEIRKKLGDSVSKSTLSMWLRDMPLSEERIDQLKTEGRKKAIVKYEIFRNTMRSKREQRLNEIYKDQLSKLSILSKDSFFVAGLMIYLGEGAKKDNYRISIANTDLRIIKFFIKWMTDFLNIPKDKIKVGLHLYENMDLEKERQFWKSELKIKESQFYKMQVRKLKKSSFSYKESFRHGTCSIYFSSVKKKAELMMAIQAFIDLYLENNKRA